MAVILYEGKLKCNLKGKDEIYEGLDGISIGDKILTAIENVTYFLIDIEEYIK
jgi:hypothetical protein